MANIATTTALVVSTQPKGQLPAGPAYLYGFGMLAILVLVIVMNIREGMKERRLRGPTPEEVMKKRKEDAFDRALREAAKLPPHHSIPERYLK